MSSPAAALILAKMKKPSDTPADDPNVSEQGLDAAVNEMLIAIDKKDKNALKSALRSAFDILDSQGSESEGDES